ncbi:MAG: tetratricopeptide repeat protein [Candidatus Kapabacteria bacterium]|nr:tetratricopeptide repeat protein [Candidatus Kapabacteria bacterium]
MKITTTAIGLLVGLVCLAFAQQASEWFGRGLNAFNGGQYAEAVKLYTKAIELDSAAAPAWYNRAAAHMRLKQYPEAHSDLDRCLRIFPGATNVKMQRAIVRSELGRYAEALDDVNTVIRGDTSFPKARLLRGRILLAIYKDTVRACADFRATLALGDSAALRYLQGACR